MQYYQLIRALFFISMIHFCVVSTTFAQSFQDDFAEIKRLEKQLFSSTAKPEEIDQLLKQLNDPKKRLTSKKTVLKQGRPYITKIIQFASISKNIDARRACAEIVWYLDASYPTSLDGTNHRLKRLYKAHAMKLLPVYWKRFHDNRQDQQAAMMLLTPHPKIVDQWLMEKSKDQQDRLRYLLLRVRERSPDKFAEDKLAQYTDQQILQILPEIFSISTKNQRAFCHRIVGHVAFRVVELDSFIKQDKNPFKGLLFVHQQVGSFRTPVIGKPNQTIHFGYRLQPNLYGADEKLLIKISQTNYNGLVARGFVSDFLGLYQMPLLKMTDKEKRRWVFDRRQPKWFKEHIPKTIESSSLAPAEIAAASLKPYLGAVIQAPKTALAVVMLPPILTKGTHPDFSQAAEAACDRIVGEVSSQGMVQIVNRAELKRLLNEYRHTKNVKKSVTSYSAMIRLTVDANELSPQTLIQIVDLSTGNLLGKKTLHWPLKETDVPSIKTFCLTALKNEKEIEKNKVRLRILGMKTTGNQVRIKPFADRLNTTFKLALMQSKKVLILNHFEIGSSVEESLLLMMGLSKLPNGQQFVPYADATIELRVTEGEGRGKTFQKTPIIIGVKLVDAKSKNNNWIETKGKVYEFDKLVDQAWNKLSGSLKAIQPGSASVVIKEMQLRRKQAEAEYHVAMDMVKNRQGIDSNISDTEVFKKAISHLETALKIDPTFATAHLALSGMRGRKNAYLDAESYVKHPQSDPQKWPIAMENASRSLWWYHTDFYVKKRQKNFKKTRKYRRLVLLMKFLVERAYEPQVKQKSISGFRKAIPEISRGMKNLNISLKERTWWVDKALNQLEHIVTNAKSSDARKRRSYLNIFRQTYIEVAIIAIEDGQNERAKQLLLKARFGVTPQKDIRYGLGVRLREATQKLNDPEALKELEIWINGITKTVGLLSVKWPRISMWGNKTSSGKLQNPEVPVTEIARVARYGHQNISPIAVDDNRVYLMLSERSHSVHWSYGTGAYFRLGSLQLASIQLDKSGNPIGNNDIEVNERRRKKQIVWKPFHIHKQPPLVSNYGKLFGKLRNKKLYLGTLYNGLLIFNPQNKTWKSYGPKQGLPTKSVESFFFLDNEKLYVGGGKNWSESRHFILNLKTDEVKLLHQGNFEKKKFFTTRLVPMWWDDEKLVDRMHTDLLSLRPSIRPDFKTNPLGSALDAVEVDGRRFFTTVKGLYEYNTHGKILRSWGEDSVTHIGWSRDFSVPRISKAPKRGRYMIKCGKLLTFMGRGKGIVVFNPKTETWYGPLDNRSICYAVGAKNGFWVAHQNSDRQYSVKSGTVYIKSEEFLKTAQKMNRVYSSRTYQKKLQQYTEKQPLLDQVKLAIMLRDNSRALKMLNTILLATPQNSEALLLRGFVQDRWGLRHPEEALKDYRALAKHSDSSTKLTGLFFELMLHQYAKDYSKMIQVSQSIKKEFPMIELYLLKSVDGYFKYASQKIKNKNRINQKQ